MLPGFKAMSVQDQRKQVMLSHQKLLKELQLKIPQRHTDVAMTADDHEMLQSAFLS